MYEGHDQAIYDILSAHPAGGGTALQDAWRQHTGTGPSFASVVVEQGLITPAELLARVAQHLGWGCAASLPDSLSPEVVAALEPGLARVHQIVPLAVSAEAVTVAALDPFKQHLREDLAFALGVNVVWVVAPPEQITGLLRKHYGEGAAWEGAPLPLAAEKPDVALTETDLEKLAGQPPIIRFVNLVLAQAVRDRASDIHFEPFADEFRIRCRVDGTLKDLPPPPVSLALPVISRIKVLANLNIAERRLPQDGRMRLPLGGRTVDLRVSTLPTQFGESAVLRILDQSAVRLDLGQLGMPATVRAAVEDVIRGPHGIFIVTGPTGSGKTTTLYSCLRELNTPDVKLLSVEDPVEYEIEGIMQVPVNVPAGLGFARALRTFLRQDPDIVMVGEIRDAETAHIAIQAALTGHLVLTTLHTNDAASAVTRLIDMGIEPFLLASTVEAVLAQRLLRRICPRCRVGHVPAQALLRQLGLPPKTDGDWCFFAGAGCADCQQTGYRGRLGLFELLTATEAFRDRVVQGASLVEIRQQAVADGLVSLREAGLAAILAGETTAEEVLKYT